MSVQATIAAVLSFIAFALAITATFAPAWLLEGEVYIGFFGSCVEGSCVSSTFLLTSNAETKVSASFMIIGTFLLLVGSLVTLCGIRISGDLLKLGGLITSFGGMAILVGTLFFTTRWLNSSVPSLTGQYSVSYGFAWTAAFLGMVGGAMAKVTSSTLA